MDDVLITMVLWYLSTWSVSLIGENVSALILCLTNALIGIQHDAGVVIACFQFFNCWFFYRQWCLRCLDVWLQHKLLPERGYGTSIILACLLICIPQCVDAIFLLYCESCPPTYWFFIIAKFLHRDSTCFKLHYPITASSGMALIEMTVFKSSIRVSQRFWFSILLCFSQMVLVATRLLRIYFRLPRLHLYRKALGAVISWLQTYCYWSEIISYSYIKNYWCVLCGLSQWMSPIHDIYIK